MSGTAAGRIEWPALEIDIPDTSPAAVATPAYDTWLELARANRAALDAVTVKIAGIPLSELRGRTRAEILTLAAAYTRLLGRDVPEFGDELVLATGHQPELVHPGIWIKYLALARLVAPHSAGLNVIVDSDAIGEVDAHVPRADGRLSRARLVLAQAGPDVPAEAVPAPDGDQWKTFAAQVDAHLATLSDEPQILEAWRRARDVVPARMPPEAGLSAAATAWRRALEGPRPYLDIPVSRMVGTPAFRAFAASILAEPARFAEVHNACLADYRAHYGVRTPAQPFPDLAVDGALIEAPFWYVDDGRRWPLLVDTGTRRLIARDRAVGSLPSDRDDADFVSLPLRPRALTMTAFKRLVVVDLFIHGIGGSRYDRATDAVVREFFGITPPAYTVVTATLFLPFRDPGPAEDERRRLHRTLLDLQHNPDRFLSTDHGPHRELVAEKWSLIRRLEGPAAITRRERRQATQRIREINSILQVAVADRVVGVQETLRHLDVRQEDSEATQSRAYPFFLHRVEAVERLVDELGA